MSSKHEPYRAWVERDGPFQWSVYLNYRYRGYWLWTFWFRRSAERVAETFNQYMAGLDEAKVQADAYDRAMREAFSRPIIVTGRLDWPSGPVERTPGQ
jgi:hypothetical protein